MRKLYVQDYTVDGRPKGYLSSFRNCTWDWESYQTEEGRRDVTGHTRTRDMDVTGIKGRDLRRFGKVKRRTW